MPFHLLHAIPAGHFPPGLDEMARDELHIPRRVQELRSRLLRHESFVGQAGHHPKRCAIPSGGIPAGEHVHQQHNQPTHEGVGPTLKGNPSRV